MTFIIGWKSRGHAFLCADSASTSRRNDAIAPSTSFGEATVNNPGLQVQESALKLVNLGRAIVAIAGDYATSKKILITLADELRHVSDIFDALAISIGEVMVDSRSQPVSLMLAAPADPEPLLFAYDSAQAVDVVHRLEEPMGVSFGSLTGLPREHAQSFISEFMSLDPLPQLHCALGVVQALGINTNLLEQFVGGAFCGVCVDRSSMRWQGDTLFVVRQPGAYWCKQVVCCIRANALLIESGVTGTTKLLAEALSGGVSDYHRTCAIDELREMIVGSRYDYVTFLTAGMPVCVVVAMEKHHESKHLRMPSGSLKALPGDVPLHCQFQLSGELMRAIDWASPDGVTPESLKRACFYFPYIPPTDDGIRGSVTPFPINPP